MGGEVGGEGNGIRGGGNGVGLGLIRIKVRVERNSKEVFFREERSEEVEKGGRREMLLIE
jgi:hypothetical protein